MSAQQPDLPRPSRDESHARPGPASADALSADERRHLRHRILWLAAPVVAEQFLVFAVNFTDVYLSGRISAEATSAIGVAAYASWLVQLLMNMVAIGVTATVARRIGAGEPQAANRIVNEALVLGLCGGIVMAAIFYVAGSQVGSVLRLTEQQNDTATRYLRIEALSYITLGLTITGTAALRASGQMLLPMLILAGVTFVNVPLSIGLVSGWGPFPQLGVDGIAWGTVTARLFGAVAMLCVLWRWAAPLSLLWPIRWPTWPTTSRLLRIGVPAAGEGLLMWSAHILFLRMIAGFGEFAFAAHVVGIEIEGLAYLPAVGWGHAAATVVGQELGKRHPQMARAAGWEAARQAMLSCGCMALLFFVGADAIFALMHDDPTVRSTGAPALRLVSLIEIPTAIVIVLSASLRGAGQTRMPLYVSAASIYLVRLPIAGLCGLLIFQTLWGAWLGMVADFVLRAIIIARYYSRGHWTETEV